MRTYGQQLKALRGKVPQEVIALRMGMSRQGNLPQYENDKKRPSVKTVLRHAAAYGKKPSEFLANVIVTEYDRIRAGEYDDVKIPATMPPMKARKLRVVEEQQRASVQKGGRRVSRRN